jgi:pimeloyl-ACP methyl ester carboxylesterase
MGRGEATREPALHVHEAGSPGSPGVVFLHGAGASGRMWAAHMARLAERFHCLAPDLPGFGQSNRLPPASLDETGELVARLIEERVPEQRAHVVGLSWGGGVTHALLGQRPELVDHAVIAFLGDMIGMDEEGRDQLRASSRRAFRAAFMEGFRSRPPSRVEAAATCPTLLVAGARETLVRPANAALATVMPHAAAVYVPGLGHGWLARRMDLHVDMVEAWLSGRDLPCELVAEPAATAATRRLLRELGREAGHADDRPAAQPR